MKMSNEHEYYSGGCQGCTAAIEQTEVDPDKLYLGWLCGRCLEELERLPLRHKIVFDRLSKKMRLIAGQRNTYKTQVDLFKNYMTAHGLNPNEAHDGYLNSESKSTEQHKRVHICGDPNDPCDCDCMDAAHKLANEEIRNET